MSWPTLPSPLVYNLGFVSSVVYKPETPSSLHDNTYGPVYLAFQVWSALVSGFILSIEPIK